jgi:hypothetical protein
MKPFKERKKIVTSKKADKLERNEEMSVMSDKKEIELNSTSSPKKTEVIETLDKEGLEKQTSKKDQKTNHNKNTELPKEKLPDPPQSKLQKDGNQYKKYKNSSYSPTSNSKSNSIKNSSKINQGDLLEFRAKRLLFYMGYFPTRGVILKTSLDEYSEDITDLDVFGVYIHKDFRSNSVWVDCKSGAARPLERISWIKGIKENFDVDNVLFIKNGIRSNVKHFARKSGVEILDLTTLDKIEKDYGIESSDWKGSWNPDIMLNKLNEFANLSIPNKDIYKRIANFISYEYWARDSYTKLKKCITALRELSRIPTSGLLKTEEQVFKWGVYELTTLFILAIQNIAKELYYYTPEDRRKALYEGLLSSDIPLKKRTEILQASYKLAFEMIKAKYPDSNPALEKAINIQPPDYFEQLLDLLSRIIDNPMIYYDILRTTDLVLMEYELHEKNLEVEEIIPLCNNFESNYKGIKTFIHFINQVTGISKDFYKVVLN